MGLQENVRAVGQFEQCFASLSGADVDDDAAFVGVRGREPQTVPVMLRLRPAGRGALRRLHQDHVSAQVGEEPSRETGCAVGEVDDAYAC